MSFSTCCVDVLQFLFYLIPLKIWKFVEVHPEIYFLIYWASTLSGRTGLKKLPLTIRLVWVLIRENTKAKSKITQIF